MIPDLPDDRWFPPVKGFRVIGLDVVPRQTKAPIRVIHPDPIFQVILLPEQPIGRGWHQLAICFPPAGIVDVVAKVSFADGEDFWQPLPVIERNHFALHVRCNSALKDITLILSGSGDLLRPSFTRFERASPMSRLAVLASRLRQVAKRDGLNVIGTLVQAGFRLAGPGTVGLGRGPATIAHEKPYDTWIRVFDEAPRRDRSQHIQRLQTLTRQPLFSILAIVQTIDEKAINRLAQSLADQFYPGWELVIAVPDAIVAVIFESLSVELREHAVHVIPHQPDPAATLNKLASKATGDFLVPTTCNAQLRPHALLELALTLDIYPEVKVIYSDEDEIGADGKRRTPSFKPAWSPDVFDVSDYFGNLNALHRETVLAAGGWDSGAVPAHDHDLKLRIVDRIEPNDIIHLAKILASVAERGSGEPVVQPNRTAAEQTIRDHCKRRDQNADVVWPETDVPPRLQYRVSEPSPLVSLVIPTRDRADILETCIRSIVTQTTYQAYEILIVDNDSREIATHRLFDKLRTAPLIRIMHHPGPFNFSALNNAAVREAKGSIIGLLNNDIEVGNGDWLGEMVALAIRREVGCVGCKLLYPDQRIQHAGVYLGLGGLAGHGHRFAARDAAGYLRRLKMLQNVSAVTAACLIIRKSVFEQVGGFDEIELKVALNDIDLCLKVRAAGYLNLLTPFAELIHHESISRGRDYAPAKGRRLWREVRAFKGRWGAALFFDPYYSPHLATDREDFSLRTR